MIGRFFNATHDGSTVGPAGPEASSAVNMALVPWKRSNGSAAWAMATVVNAKADRNIFNGRNGGICLANRFYLPQNEI